jgi:hypothetical protein
LIGLSPKKLKLSRFPKIEDSMERCNASPFGPPIYVRRGGLWAKHMGFKGGAIGNTFEEHIGNLMESIGNLKGTCWEQRKNEKNPPTSPNPKLK